MASHVSQCMAKACMCDTWHAMCQHAWLLPCLYKELTWAVGRSKGKLQTSLWSSKEKRKGGKEKEEERRRQREERKGGREERKGERKEEKRRGKGRKRGKRKRKRKMCYAVSRPGRQRTRNCAIRGRFPPTLVILRLGVV